MIIPKKILSKWEAIRSPQDTKKLSALMGGKYREAFARAFKTGKCSDEVFEVMAKFYDDKANKIKGYL